MIHDPKDEAASSQSYCQLLEHNLDFYDAIFFFGIREIDLTPQQLADLVTFLKACK